MFTLFTVYIMQLYSEMKCILQNNIPIRLFRKLLKMMIFITQIGIHIFYRGLRSRILPDTKIL